MIERKVTIEGKEYRLRSSALIPRLYRASFGRDMIADMRKLAAAYKAAMAFQDEDEKQGACFDLLDLEIFENVAWLMMHYAGEDVGEKPEEWLDSLDGIFDIYQVMPTVLELWSAENKTTSKPRKK